MQGIRFSWNRRVVHGGIYRFELSADVLRANSVSTKSHSAVASPLKQQQGTTDDNKTLKIVLIAPNMPVPNHLQVFCVVERGRSKVRCFEDIFFDSIHDFMVCISLLSVCGPL